jgi:hypothetical protein
VNFLINLKKYHQEAALFIDQCSITVIERFFNLLERHRQRLAATSKGGWLSYSKIH